MVKTQIISVFIMHFKHMYYFMILSNLIGLHFLKGCESQPIRKKHNSDSKHESYRQAFLRIHIAIFPAKMSLHRSWTFALNNTL